MEKADAYIMSGIVIAAYFYETLQQLFLLTSGINILKMKVIFLGNTNRNALSTAASPEISFLVISRLLPLSLIERYAIFQKL